MQEAFVIDVKNAIWSANFAMDQSGEQRIRYLWLDYFDVALPAMGAVKLRAYLESRKVWRADNGLQVFKTEGEPCIAYTAYIEQQQLRLIALGCCYRYPLGNEADWWTDVIQPRLRTL